VQGKGELCWGEGEGGGGQREGVVLVKGDGCHSFPGNAGYSASIFINL
jgi:hypothetical protein